MKQALKETTPNTTVTLDTGKLLYLSRDEHESMDTDFDFHIIEKSECCCINGDFCFTCHSNTSSNTTYFRIMQHIVEIIDISEQVTSESAQCV